MGKLERLRISLLNDTNDVYFVGQKVNGMVQFKLNEPMKVRQIWLSIDGRAKTSWNKNERYSAGSKSSRTRHYSSTETYIDCRILLWPSQNQPMTSCNQVHDLYPGHYAFPFAFTIPDNCPSSFEASYGNIRYTCKAVIHRPWRFDVKCKLPFTVAGLVDLNKEINVLKPLNITIMKKISFLCFFSGSAECHVTLERCGFAPGEKIPLFLSVWNNSSSEIVKVEAQLVEIVVFLASCGRTQRSKTKCRVVLKEQNSTPIKPNHRQQWSHKLLQVPPIAPTLNSCGIIKISYELQIKIVPSGIINRPLTQAFPIFIGTVPLSNPRHSNGQQNGHSVSNVMPAMANGYSNGNSLQYSNSSPKRVSNRRDYTFDDSIAPPSYAEAVFGAADLRDEDQDETFLGPSTYTPRYPFYGKEPNFKNNGLK